MYVVLNRNLSTLVILALIQDTYCATYTETCDLYYSILIEMYYIINEYRKLVVIRISVTFDKNTSHKPGVAKMEGLGQITDFYLCHLHFSLIIF